MPVSEAVANDYIRTWRRARLSTDAGGLNYPSINILHPKFGVGMSGQPEQQLTDADCVQSIVNSMPEDIRAAFEALHVGVIRGHSCLRLPNRVRAHILAISERTYYRRVKSGQRIIQDALDG